MFRRFPWDHLRLIATNGFITPTPFLKMGQDLLTACGGVGVTITQYQGFHEHLMTIIGTLFQAGAEPKY